MDEKKKYPDSIQVDQKLIAMIEEYDILFDLTWDDDADPNYYIQDWQEQGEEIVELIRIRMGLPETCTADPKRRAERKTQNPQNTRRKRKLSRK